MKAAQYLETMSGVLCKASTRVLTDIVRFTQVQVSVPSATGQRQHRRGTAPRARATDPP